MRDRLVRKVLLSIIMVSLMLVNVFQSVFSANAISIKNEEIVDRTQKESVSNSGQPDLIITNIDVVNLFFEPNSIEFTIKNIGNAEVDFIKGMTAKCDIYKLKYLFFPTYYKTQEVGFHFDPMGPGDSCTIRFGSDESYPTFGFFKFCGEVYTEGESNYKNNKLTNTFFHYNFLDYDIWFKLW